MTWQQDAETAREGLRFPADDHHDRCDSRKGEPCNCYARFAEPYHVALDRLSARLARYEEALRLTEWGSCDGCGTHACCPHCTHWRDEGHAADCLVGAALADEEPVA